MSTSKARIRVSGAPCIGHLSCVAADRTPQDEPQSERSPSPFFSISCCWAAITFCGRCATPWPPCSASQQLQDLFTGTFIITLILRAGVRLVRRQGEAGAASARRVLASVDQSSDFLCVFPSGAPEPLACRRLLLVVQCHQPVPDFGVLDLHGGCVFAHARRRGCLPSSPPAAASAPSPARSSPGRWSATVGVSGLLLVAGAGFLVRHRCSFSC